MTAGPDLQELTRRAREDRAALRDLFAALFPRIHKHLSFLLGFSSLVDDAVQESMLQIHRALPAFRGESSVETWALAIASRTAFKQARRERKHLAESLDVTDLGVYGPEDVVAGAEWRLLVKALGRLHIKKRIAFVVMGILEHSATEAGEILGTSANTAASRYRHARHELLEILKTSEGFDEIDQLPGTIPSRGKGP
jgi:RNA polymerase sigma-70 factor, ECF subfamily